MRLRDGWRSLRSAWDSIWRMRSRVRPNSLSDLLERPWTPVVEAEAEPEDALLTAVEAVEHPVELLLEHLVRDGIERRDGVLVLDQAPSSVSPSSPIGVSSETGRRP